MYELSLSIEEIGDLISLLDGKIEEASEMLRLDINTDYWERKYSSLCVVCDKMRRAVK